MPGQPSPSTAPRASVGLSTADVVLVNMPFAGFRQPSLALGLLKASLAPLDVTVEVLDATLVFAGMISPAAYDTIATWRSEDLLGDRVFADHLPRPTHRTWSEYEERILAGGLPEHRVPYFGKPPLGDVLRAQLDNVRERAGELLDTCLEEIIALRPAVVGFSSMVHQQTASLALAARVKAVLPDTYVVFGGASCRGEMGAELLHSFPYVDAVAAGDGEELFPQLVRRWLAGEKPTALPSLPGLLARDHPTGMHTPADTHEPAVTSGLEPAAVMDLDRLPLPDYSDYFARLAQSPLRHDFTPRIPFETSRGCWWGEKRRCVFCGQASATMDFRAKSSDRALAELQSLTARYPDSPVLFTDEILPRHAFDDFLPRIADTWPDLEVVYFEVRPDITRDQLDLLAACGVRRLEAGLESLSTPVLRLMRKGTAVLQNLQFLKWARELGIEVVWNVLWGLPGEDPAQYEVMAGLVPLITHLHPPNAVGPFRLDRFSPIYQQPHQSGIAGVRPYPSYSYVYDLSEDALSRLAYSFAFDYRHPQPVELYTASLAERLAAWKDSWPHSVLAFTDDGERLVFYDRRPGFEDAEELTVVDGAHRAAYLACDAVQSVARLTASMSTALETSIAPRDVEEILQSLVDERLMLADGDTYLSLGLRAPGRSGGTPARDPAPG